MNIEGGQGKMEGNTYLSINNNLITTIEACYLLSNYNGYMDGDKKCLRIKLKSEG